MTQRLDWIDIAKGFAITLVVIGHTGRGLSRAGLPDDPGILGLIDAAIYAFHMPLFFILSGITFGMRPPANIQPALLQRVWRLFYAMVIWTYVFLAMRALAGSHSNSGGTWQDMLVWPLPPFQHLWFLWALLVITVVCALLRFALRPILSDLAFWACLLGASVIAFFTIDLSGRLSLLFTDALNYSMAFVIGALFAVSPVFRIVPAWPVAALGGLAFAAALWVGVFVGLPGFKVVSGSVISLCLLVPLISLSARFGQAGWLRGLAYLGMLSLPIYVMHTMFSGALRIGLVQAGITDLALHLFLGVAIGILGPLAAYRAARRLGWLRLVGLA